MNIVDTFEHFAQAFETCIADDNWSRLARYLTEDATYINVGGPDPKCEGRQAILAYLQADVERSDRRFDSRTLVALSPPSAAGSQLSRRWRCTYTLAGAPDLVVEGEARYRFRGNLIESIEEELTPESASRLNDWMHDYGDRLGT